MFQSLFQVHRAAPRAQVTMTSRAGFYLKHSLWFAFATQASSRPVPTGMNEEGPHPGAFPSLLNPFDEVSFCNKVGFYFLFFFGA